MTGTTSLTHTWQASSNADVAGYLLDLGGTVLDVGNTTRTTTAILADGPHAWTVAADDAVGNTGACAGTWSFTTRAHRLYLPLVVRNYLSAPGEVVGRIFVDGGGAPDQFE